MSNPLILFIMSSKTGQIDGYLKDRNKDIYRKALFYFINEHEKSKSNIWDSFLNVIAADERYAFVKRLLDWFDDTNELTEFVLFKRWNDVSFFQSLCKNGDIEVLKYVLFDKRIRSDNDKCKSLARSFASEIPSNFNETLKALMNGANDMQMLNTFSMIFDVYKHKVAFQHKAFNYFTIKTPVFGDTEFRVVDDTVTHFSDNLYCFGSNGVSDNERLGLGDLRKSISEPTICAAFIKKKIVKISSYLHSLCIDTNGCVYAWGMNECGQLGLGDCDNRCTPQMLDVLKSHNALDVAVGCGFSLILTDKGNVWSCGDMQF
eukprot:673157_1